MGFTPIQKLPHRCTHRVKWCAAENRCHAMLFVFRQADPQVQVQRPCALLGEEPTNRLAGDPADDLANQVTIGKLVIHEGRSWRPKRLHRSERRHGGVPVELFVKSDAAFRWETRQPGSMGQQIRDRYVRFPVGRELRPIVGNWSIRVQQATLNQQVCTRCRHTLATRHDDADRVGGVRSIIHLIAPRPEIHHPFPMTIDAQLRTTFILQLRLGKGLAYSLEAIFYNSIYFAHVNSSQEQETCVCSCESNAMSIFSAWFGEARPVWLD